MEEKILADAIIDRITTNAHATVLTCDDSWSRTRSPRSSTAPRPAWLTDDLLP
jgi:hypothetical protein